MATTQNGYGNLDLSPYKVESRREIVSLLRAISEQKQLIRLLMEGSGEATVTSILQVDDETGSVIVDVAPNAAVNARLLASDNLSFETVLDHIRIVFFTTQIEACTYTDRPAFRIDVPATVIRLQRREFYRVPTPINAPVFCMVHLGGTDSHQNVTLPLQNVSGGGIAIIDEKRVLDNTVGLTYPDCQIHLSGRTVIITTLQIRNSQEIKLDNGKSLRRLGCLFVGLPKPMLAVVQRYIGKLEREQNAKVAGIL